MKKVIFTIVSVLSFLFLFTTAKAGVSIVSFSIKSQFLVGSQLRPNPGATTPFTADFTIGKAGDSYNTVIVSLILQESSGATTVLSSTAATRFSGDWGNSPVWEGSVSGILPANKTSGSIYLKITVYEGNTQGATSTSVTSYSIYTNTSGGGGGITMPPNPGPNPYPGTYVMNAWTNIAGEEQNLRASDIGLGYPWKFAGHAFYVYGSQVESTVPVYEFTGKYSDKSETYLYSTVRNQDPFWSFTGRIFYTYNTQVAGTLPVYCYTNAGQRNHFFTQHIQTDPYWHQLYIAFYALPYN